MNNKTVNTELNSFRETATSIKILVRSLELRLSGKKWLGKGNEYSEGGVPLCGTSVINKATALLHPFCEESNLITMKDITTFERQKYNTNRTLNALLMENSTTNAQDNKIIFEMFANTLQNIGDIILGSKQLMKDIINGNEETPGMGM